jgi:hypothetical protein
MPLPPSDTDYLQERDIAHEITEEAGMTCVVLPSWPLPKGYTAESADLLIRLQPGYPDLPPDMWWFEPAVELINGPTIQATEVREPHLGRTWQRWSRHLTPEQWQSGVDGLESYLALIARELERCVPEPAR